MPVMSHALDRFRSRTSCCSSSVASALVGFQRNIPDFLLKNPDFLLKNPDFPLKNVDVLIKTDAAPTPAGMKDVSDF